jgi:organic radical activating enzyme
VSKTYAINSIFDTLQGEGARAGSRAVFIRFSGCNAWSGREQDRSKGKAACAKFCDTAFFDGEDMAAADIIKAIDKLWPFDAQDYQGVRNRWCVLTGGEPMLQVDPPLLDMLKAAGWHVAMETNGSIHDEEVEHKLDWMTVSPKKGLPVKAVLFDEMKLVLPGAVPAEAGWTDEEILELVKDFHGPAMYVQPQDCHAMDRYDTDGDLAPEGLEQVQRFGSHIKRCIDFVRKHPDWRLGIQAHKYLGLE